MNSTTEAQVIDVRKEIDSMGEVNVPSGKLWGAQTQRSLEHFSIGHDLMPREMISAFAILKKAAANANHAGGRLDNHSYRLIVQACDEILAGEHEDHRRVAYLLGGEHALGVPLFEGSHRVLEVGAGDRAAVLEGTPADLEGPRDRGEVQVRVRFEVFAEVGSGGVERRGRTSGEHQQVAGTGGAGQRRPRGGF